MGRKIRDQNSWKMINLKRVSERGHMKGTASHSRAIVVPNRVERGHFSLDAGSLRKGPVRKLWPQHPLWEQPPVRNSSQVGISQSQSIWKQLCQLLYPMVLSQTQGFWGSWAKFLLGVVWRRQKKAGPGRQ